LIQNYFCGISKAGNSNLQITSLRSDFCVYSGLDQIISCCALAKPKPNVFIEEIPYILLIATPVEVVVLATFFPSAQKNSLTEADLEGEISLLPSKILT
jgi:hypothetical protein